MPHSISNGAKTATGASGLGDQTGKASVSLKASTQISSGQGGNALRQVTQHLGKNPQNAPSRGQNPQQTPPNRQEARRSENNAPTADRPNNQNETGRTQARNNNYDPKNNNRRNDDSRTPAKQTSYEPNTRGGNDPATTSRTVSDQTNTLVRTTVSQLLQKTEIYVNPRTLTPLTESPNTQNKPVTLPLEVTTFVQKLTDNLSNLLTSSRQANNRLVSQTVADLPAQMSREIRIVKEFLINNPAFETKSFVNMTIDERMSTAVEMMLQYLPDSIFENLPANPAEEILNALLMARGIIVPQENPVEIINILNQNLPGNFSMTDLRDLGRLVKTLIIDAGAAKSFGNLDLAVQKFVKLLAANDEFGVLMAAINLAGQPENGSLSRSLAIVQIYDFINRLMEAGEKALKQAANENSAKNIVQKDAKENFLAVSVKDNRSPGLRTGGENAAAGSLRRFLEFNPNMTHDKAVSAFINPDDARNAQKDFSNMFQNEIEDWLQSGNHRFVKDYDLEKPIGIVVERRRDGFFNATQMRLVLVRDGSVEGWHFLKSFLVR